MPAPTSRKRTQRLRRYWDRHARTYDQQIAFWERHLFADGRRWVCSQAIGDVLEVAIGTGRNLAHYPTGIRLTGIEFSPEMLRLARRRPGGSAGRSTCAWATPRRWSCPTARSTRWCAPCRCAPSPTSGKRSPR